MSFILRWTMGFLMDGFAGIFEMVGSVSKNCFENTVVTGILSAFKSVGLPLVAISMLVLMLKSMLSASNGDAVSITDTGKRCLAGVVIYSYGVQIVQNLYLVMLDLCQNLVDVIVGVTSSEVNLKATLFEEIVNALPALILLVVMIYYMFKVFLDLTERFWQLLVMLCMMYVYIPSYIAGDDESLVLWFKQCLSIIMTQVFQTILITTGMSIFLTSGSYTDFFMTIGALVAASKTEQLLDRYGMGAGGKLGGLARNGMSAAFYAKSIFGNKMPVRS